jgi:hypothetical protein
MLYIKSIQQKTCQTFGYPEAKLLPRASSKQQRQMVLSEVTQFQQPQSDPL